MINAEKARICCADCMEGLTFSIKCYANKNNLYAGHACSLAQIMNIHSHNIKKKILVKAIYILLEKKPISNDFIWPICRGMDIDL